MTIKLYDISHLFEAGEIVFFKKELYKTSNSLHQQILNGDVTPYDIFGNVMSPNDAANQLLNMVDSPEIISTTEAIYYNMELGKQILALWREYVIIKSKELGITVNYVERVRSEEAACQYLIHNNEETKHHYEIKELFGSPSGLKMFDKAIEQGEVSEGEKVIELIEIIESSENPLTMSAFARYCAANNRWDIFRRSASIFIKMIEEQNKKLKGIES